MISKIFDTLSDFVLGAFCLFCLGLGVGYLYWALSAGFRLGAGLVPAIWRALA